MKFDKPHTAQELANILGLSLKGKADVLVSGINEMNRVSSGDVVFVDHSKYYNAALESPAVCVLIDIATEVPAGKALIISDNPFRDHNKLVSHFHRIDEDVELSIDPSSTVHPSAYVHPSAQIGKDTVIHAGVRILHNVSIGDRVVIQANSVIGGDAFYYKKRSTGYERMLSCGTVVIEDDVEIGPGCTIDRGVSADTRIGAGTKIDCQVQIGHDTVVGKNCLMAAQVGVSGACTIGDNVTLWGQVGIPSKTYIGDGAVFLGQSGAMPGHVEPNKVYFGSPAGEKRQKFMELAALKKLPEVLRKKQE